MFTPLTGLPDNVIGFEVSGKVEAKDYTDVLIPALKAAADRGEVRAVIVMPEYEGFSAGALWPDIKTGIEYWGKWKRIALVTDVPWMEHAVDWFGWMTPGDVKHFPTSERAAAIEWAAGVS